MRFFRRSAIFLKQQNWFAYLIEVCIVVLGVYIAYQLTIWNEATKARAANRVMLENLYNENSINIHELGRLNTYRKSIVGSTDKLLRLLDKDQPIAEDTLAYAVFAILRTSIPVVVTNVLDEYLRNHSTDYPQLNIELYKLRGYYNDLINVGNIHWSKKDTNYYSFLNSSFDFNRQRVISFQSIKSLSFKNNIYFLLDSEQEFTRLHNQAYFQGVKVKQMIDVLK
jgi:hypothetical protein